jgi:predicted nucleic acid-binding protein
VIAVLDASVIVKWFFPDPAREPDSDRALAVLEGIRAKALEPMQPPHWLAEVAAVISRLDRKRALQAIDLLDAMEFPVIGEAVVYRRASTLAADLNQHLFDTLYHAVALEQGATLISADRRYYHKARHLGQIVYLADWQLT